MIRKKKYKGMFVAASIFGFISAFINFVYIGMFKDVIINQIKNQNENLQKDIEDKEKEMECAC